METNQNNDNTTEQNRVENIERLRSISERRKAYRERIRNLGFFAQRQEIDRDDQLINFSGADLRGADLRGTILYRGDNFIGANLEGANLEGSNLRGAFLINANLIRANLEGADLEGSELTSANLTNANLQGANLKYGYFINTNFTEANLTDANLKESRLRNAILTRAILTRANVEDANLEGANINDAADLTDVNLETAFFTTREYNEALEYEDDDGNDYTPQQGIAYEIHNSFAKFEPLKNKYLEIINQPNKQYGDIYNYIQEKFTTNIRTLFPDDSEKLSQFTTAFDRINTRISENYNDLIGKSIDFAFSQDDNFKKEYLITFLDESCNAYSGPGDNTSCVKGIIERFILGIGSTVQILCAEGCDNETYQKLDKLFNPKFNIAEAANDWWTNSAETEEIKNMTKEERKEHFKKYLSDKAKELNNYNDDIEQKITNYANEIDYSFENLVLGGRKTRKTKRNMKIRKTVKSKRNKKSRNSIRSIRSKKSRKTIRYKPAKKSRKTRKSRKH